MTVTQSDIARRAGVDVSTVNKILNKRPGPVFRKETIKRVFKAARELGFRLDRLKHGHRRQHPRKEASISVELSIYMSDGSLFDRGSAVMKDVSLSGALLSAMIMPLHGLPLKPHTLGLRLLDGDLKGLEIIGRPVRFTSNGGVINLAIEFLKTEDVKVQELRKIV
jgi:transcriptional regulator with XRE-family HTH domain